RNETNQPESRFSNLERGCTPRSLIGQVVPPPPVLQKLNLTQPRSVTKAAAAISTGMPRKQAVNSTITRMDGFVDRALAEGWTIKPYGRDFDLPPSALALVLWETVLREPLNDAVRDQVLDDRREPADDFERDRIE
ncbi:hypothetical protein, partial [Deinococcus xinjiangensis]